MSDERETESPGASSADSTSSGLAVKEREQRVRRAGAADVQRRLGVDALAVIRSQDLARRLLVHAVDDPAERTIRVVVSHQHHRLLEVRVAQRRRRDQQVGRGERLHPR